jgi:hypothetical protein
VLPIAPVAVVVLGALAVGEGLVVAVIVSGGKVVGGVTAVGTGCSERLHVTLISGGVALSLLAKRLMASTFGAVSTKL